MRLLNRILHTKNQAKMMTECVGTLPVSRDVSGNVIWAVKFAKQLLVFARETIKCFEGFFVHGQTLFKMFYGSLFELKRRDFLATLRHFKNTLGAESKCFAMSNCIKQVFCN